MSSRWSALLLVVGLGLTSCAGNSDWLEFRGERGRGATKTLISPPLAIKWKLQLQVSGQTDSFNPPVVFDNTVYFGSGDGNFYALDIDSGYMRWIYKSRAPINSVPFADSSRVYFGSNDGNAYAVAIADGSEAWAFPTGHTVQSLVLKYDDMVMFTSDRGDSFFVDPDGNELHRIPNPVWSYHTFQVFDGVMYWAPGPVERGVSLGAYDIEDRSYLWILDRTSPNAVWYSFPALEKDSLYYATGADFRSFLQFTYYALNRHTGEVLWSEVDDSFMNESDALYDPVDLFYVNLRLLDYLAPSLWRNLVIYTSGDAVVRAFRNDTGDLAWRHVFVLPTSSASTVAGDRVYLGVRGDPFPGGRPARIVCLAARTGRLLWEMELEGAILGAPVVSGNYVIFGTDESYFYVLQEVF